MTFCWCFGTRMMENRKLKGKSDQKSKRDKSLSSAKPARTSLEGSEKRQSTGRKCKSFTYRELATATNNFRMESLIGRGGFGAVFKGKLESTGQSVAVKMLDESGVQGDKEFLVEVLMLSLLRHENLVKLLGYCAEGEQRLVVYEYMALGSVEDHLQGSRGDQNVLDWKTRMQIALGAAKGLDYLHNEADPPVIYRDLKSANILLDHNYKPKLSDFGLAKFGPSDDMSHVSTRVMGTHGYCAPEYASSGKLTLKSDIYSFGVVLLELITGRQAISDSSSMGSTRVLVNWALPLFNEKKIMQIVDPALKGRYLESTLKRALDVAFMCLREHANARPTISDVVVALDYIVNYTPRRQRRMSVGSSSSSSSRGGDLERNVTATVRSSSKTTRMLSVSEEEEEEIQEVEEENGDVEREKAVAEAKSWAENLRHLRRQSIEPPSPSPGKR